MIVWEFPSTKKQKKTQPAYREPRTPPKIYLSLIPKMSPCNTPPPNSTPSFLPCTLDPAHHLFTTMPPPDHHRKVYVDLSNLLSDPDDTHLLARLFITTRDFLDAIAQFAMEKARESSDRYKQSARYEMANHYVFRESPKKKVERERVARERRSEDEEERKGL